MILIACVSTKGGVGKTTTATNLAAAGAAEGLSVLLVDGDLQKSSLYWRGIRPDNAKEGINATAMPSTNLHKDLGKLASSYDVCIIDCGGGAGAGVLRSAMFACGKGVVTEEGGIALIMLGASQFDMWGLQDTTDCLNEARSFVDIDAYTLLNNLPQGTKATKKTMDAITELEDMPLLETRLHARAAFKNASETGLGVVETEPKSKAADEVWALWNELKNIQAKMKGAKNESNQTKP